MDRKTGKWITTLGGLGGPGIMWVISELGIEWPKGILIPAGVVFTAMFLSAVYLWTREAAKWLANWQRRSGRTTMLLPLALIAISTIGLCVGILWFSHAHLAPELRSATNEAPKKDLTLLDLFHTDFKEADCIPVFNQVMRLPTGEEETIKKRFCKIPMDHMKYRGHAIAIFYIPVSHYTGLIMDHIAKSFTDLWPYEHRKDVLISLDSRQIDHDVENYWMFLAPIYIYCELPPKNAKQLLDKLSEKGMPATIRSTAYLDIEKKRRGLN